MTFSEMRLSYVRITESLFHNKHVVNLVIRPESVRTHDYEHGVFFWWEREGMRHAPSRLSADVEDSIRARQVGLRPLDGSALCPTP